MEQVNFAFYDIVQIVLLLAACYACRMSGYQKGIVDAVDFFHDKGIIDFDENDDIVTKDKITVKNKE
jgi:hypothetical protein